VLLFCPLDLGERVGHRGLHADAEHVQLDHPGDLRVVLVELAEREALAAFLDGGAVEQGLIGQEHAARVHGDVPRQAVELLGDDEDRFQLGLVEPGAAELGELGQRRRDVLGADVREGLRDRADLVGRQ
jgi:hypothetical protein